MKTFIARDYFDDHIHWIGVVRDDAFDKDENAGGELKKQRMLIVDNFLMDMNFMKILLENEALEDTDQEIFQDRWVGRILPHILSTHEDSDLFLPLRQFPITEIDIKGWTQGHDTQSVQRTDHPNQVANACGLRRLGLSKGRKRAFPNKKLETYNELKKPPSYDQSQDIPSSHSGRLGDDGTDDSVNLPLRAAANENLQQDTAQSRQLEIHPSQQERMDSIDQTKKDPPAANLPLVDQGDTDTRGDASPVTPQLTDILLGRGSFTNNNPGNKQYLQLIPEYSKLYERQVTKLGKKSVVNEMLERLRVENRRFLYLKSKDGLWYEVDRRKQYNKVSHALRDYRKPEIQRQRQVAQCNTISQSPKKRQRLAEKENDDYSHFNCRNICQV